MGLYIETPVATGKERYLRETYGARLAAPPPPDRFESPGEEILICVVRNGMFDAAGVIFDEVELEAFTDPDDPRPRTWLTMPTEKVRELVPRLTSYLAAREKASSR